MEKEENGKTVGPQRKHRDLKLVRDLGSVKASEFAAEPSESDAESHSLQRYNAEGEAWGVPRRFSRDTRSRGDLYRVHPKKGVAPSSFLRSLRVAGKY